MFMIRGHMLQCPNNIEFDSLNVVFVLANSAGPDKVPHLVAFRFGLYCLQSTTKGYLISLVLITFYGNL